MPRALVCDESIFYAFNTRHKHMRCLIAGAHFLTKLKYSGMCCVDSPICYSKPTTKDCASLGVSMAVFSLRTSRVCHA